MKALNPGLAANDTSQAAGGSKVPMLKNVVTMATAALVTAISLLSFVSQKELAVSQLRPPSLQTSNHKNITENVNIKLPCCTTTTPHRLFQSA